tara:strand:- start:53 stop:646 length:594 start_codon:yes stop_codon:yes gene_type:complete
MEKETQVRMLFPTPVWVTPFNGDNYNSELEWIKNLEYIKDKGMSVDTFILDSPIMENIKSFIELSISRYTSQIWRYEEEFYITQSWVNKKGKGDSHHEHTHPNSIISGVWYPQVSKDSSILFKAFHETSIDIDPLEWNEFNSYVYRLFVESGSLILFPSYIKHSVSPIQSDTERISLSFNTWIRGSLGKKENLTYLP